MNELTWAFNLKVYIDTYNSLIDFEPASLSSDWNVRTHSDGTIHLDNHYKKKTTTVTIQDDILDIEVRPWDATEAIRDGWSPSVRQTMDLLQTTRTWRDSKGNLMQNPSLEAFAFIEHLYKLGYFPPVYTDHLQEDLNYDY
jgi:hypothetical protein